MNASDVIDDRVVLEHGNVQYLACIVPDFDPVNPLKDWSHGVSFYVPVWGGNSHNGSGHLASMIGNDLPPIDLSRAPDYLYEKTMNASWYEDETAADWLKLFRTVDPSGMYFIVEYWEDRGSSSYPALKVVADDDESTRDYAIVYIPSGTIRQNWNVKRITKATRENVREVIDGTLNVFNAWANGDVYGYYTLRQELDDDGETISSEEIEYGSCWGYYGSDEWEYMYSEAKSAAEADYARREEEASASFLSLDLFDAASYPEPTLYDVAGAYQARLNEGMEAIGAATRKLRDFEPTLEEGEDPMGLWGVMGPIIKEVCNRPIKPIAIG